jgi:hypothetical protein
MRILDTYQDKPGKASKEKQGNSESFEETHFVFSRIVPDNERDKGEQ